MRVYISTAFLDKVQVTSNNNAEAEHLKKQLVLLRKAKDLVNKAHHKELKLQKTWLHKSLFGL